MDPIRRFEAGPDPYGEIWQVEFLWLQTAISIRHSDSVDVKFLLTNGPIKMERVVSLPHPALLELSRNKDRPLTDPWCMRLAAQHVRRMIETGEDVEKTLVTVSAEDLDRCSTQLDRSNAKSE